MKKKTSKAKKKGGVVINARDRTSLNLADVDKAVKDMKRTAANNATIVVGPETQVEEDVRNFAAKRGVE